MTCTWVPSYVNLKNCGFGCCAISLPSGLVRLVLLTQTWLSPQKHCSEFQKCTHTSTHTPIKNEEGILYINVMIPMMSNVCLPTGHERAPCWTCSFSSVHCASKELESKKRPLYNLVLPVEPVPTRQDTISELNNRKREESQGKDYMNAWLWDTLSISAWKSNACTHMHIHRRVPLL